MKSPIFCFVLFLALSGSVLCANEAGSPGVRAPGAPTEIPKLDIATAPEASEPLFLIRLIEGFYMEWPETVDQGKNFQAKLGDLRDRSYLHSENIKGRKLEEPLAPLYDKFLTMVRAYISSLDDAKFINKKSTENMGWDIAQGMGGIATGAARVFFMGDVIGGYSNATTGASNVFRPGATRTEEKVKALTAILRQRDENLSNFIGSLQNAAFMLTDKYNWPKGAAGCLAPKEDRAAFQKIVGLYNPAKPREAQVALARFTATAKEQRPNDPLVILWYFDFLPLIKERPPEAMLERAADARRAATLIPAPSIYDAYRAKLLFTAATLTTEAVRKKMASLGESWSTCSDPATAAQAVGLWDACLKLFPRGDPSGEMEEERAWALAACGHYKEALTQALAVQDKRGANAAFTLNLAALQSLSGNPEGACASLKLLFGKYAYPDILRIKNDPDFQPLRDANVEPYATLVRPRCALGIDLGWKTGRTLTLGMGFGTDDVILTNKSPYPLTHVHVSGHVVDAKGKETPLDLKTERLKPGQAHKWEKVFTLSRGEADTQAIKIECDQTAGDAEPASVEFTKL
ncbi:MAG: hypothetical protein ACFUZC_19495 [Chthoniobacteraceae bacterium]